jgi:hypothetical protein
MSKRVHARGGDYVKARRVKKPGPFSDWRRYGYVTLAVVIQLLANKAFFFHAFDEPRT